MKNGDGRVALGRWNFLFVGDVDAGDHIAGLHTLIATCEARGIHSFEYLADVVPRIDEELPDKELDNGTNSGGDPMRLEIMNLYVQPSSS